MRHSDKLKIVDWYISHGHLETANSILEQLKAEVVVERYMVYGIRV